MSWAGKRRLIIILILAAIAAALIAVTVIASIHKTPSCTDNIQDGNETGIDCGGSCAFLCTNEELAPTVLYTRIVSNGAGRFDLVSSVENKNINAAAQNVPYTISILDKTGATIKTIHAIIDLPPNATQPIFVAGVGNGAATAFLTFDNPDAIRWFTLSPSALNVPTVTNAVIGGTADNPRITATLSNTSALPLANIVAVVLVRDASGNVIASSETVVSSLPAEGTATALFTWNGPFSEAPASIVVNPVIPLSR